MLLVRLVHAAPGELDPTFGSGGRVVTTREGGEFVDLDVQPDRKIVVVGNVGPSAVVMRYLANGTLDPSFGTGGVVDLVSRRAGGVVVHPDGIVIAGVPSTPARAFFLLRLRFDGSLDTDFGSGGVVTESSIIGVPPGGGGFIEPVPSVCNGAVLIADDGDIVVGLAFTAGAMRSAAAVRYQASGAPEPTFVGHESFRMSLSPMRPGFGLANVGGDCSDVALDGAGGIVFGGTGVDFVTPMLIGTYANFGRISADDGTIDEAFGGGDGNLYVGNGSPSQTSAGGVSGDGNGRLLLSVSGSGAGLGRYELDGAFDPSFDTSAAPDDLALGATGHILSLLDWFGVRRLLADGTTDDDFGSATTSFAGWPSTEAVTLVEDANGDIVVGGRLRASNSSDDGFALARFRGGELVPGTPLAGKALTLKSSSNPSSKRLALASVDAGLGLGAGPDTVDDPRLAGATLRVSSDAGAPFDATYVMPAAGWSAIIKRGELVGWQFRHPTGVVRLAQIEAGRRLKVVARGAELTHDLTANPDAVSVTLSLGDHAMCFEFGGQVRFSAERSYRAKNALAPASCE